MIWEAVGWAGNACYFSRFLVQWLASERAKRTVAPPVFWWLSLSGALLAGTYTVYRGEPVLLVGFIINALIYARNISYGRPGAPPQRIGMLTTTLVGIGMTAVLLLTGTVDARDDWGTAPVWVSVSIVGEAIWVSRFVVQWWFTERRGDSHFPIAFWWLSLVGNSLLLAYVVHLRDPVYIAGLALGPFVQIRNLMLGDGRR